ncbi:DUF3365 domain-containing protein [Sulfitobacter sp. D35]|uniref:c-type heme family protein n=1 Tax=Sulfitobacter sp. D35 TaxID=3083252 RepID=UPI00296ECD1E|nr:DUF3365 domain-containing protein [Sulfitobacter sp. D35]MDW4498510.1 DUF3365 domain-containing protein [Sulfitobacter sp. D35]
MFRRCALIVAASLVSLNIAPEALRADAHLEEFVDEGNRLAALLRAGRGVVSVNQDLINNPDIADKGLDAETFLAAVHEQYRDAYGTGPLDGDLSDEQRRLTQAQLDAMGEIIDENQDLINSEGLGFKGFIPAVFARLVNERFGEKLGGSATMKVTAPPELVRNRKARPDAWEAAVIDERFQSGDWTEGEAFFEEIASDGDARFRMLIPEYYGASCLTCHGGPKGEVDITGFPKEGGAAGDLAGAISITLRQ